MAAGTICETGETGENAVVGARFRSIVDETVNKSNFLTGLTGLSPLSLSLQKWPFEVGQTGRATTRDALTRYSSKVLDNTKYNS